MDFSLTDEQLATSAAVRRYLQDQYPDAQRGDPVDMPSARRRWQGLAEMGLLGMAVDERWGGSQQGPVGLALLAREMGRCHAGEGYLSSIVLAGTLLQALGSTEQCERWLLPTVAGQQQLALAHSEPQARYTLSDVQTRAQAVPDGWRIDGHKSLVLGGAQADALLVLARTEGAPRDTHGLSLFIVPATTDGLAVQHFQTLDGRHAAHIDLHHARVPHDALLGPLHQAFPALQQATDLALVWTCAESVGAMETLIERTTEHLKTRRQFGAPLARFQALQHRLADTMIGLEQADAMVMAAAMLIDHAPPEVRQKVLATTKVITARAAQATSEAAIQMHGAMGMTAECRVGHFAKLLTTLSLYLGDAQHHLRWYAEHAIAPSAAATQASAPTTEKEFA
jgi:pimeloyl-CoA dehydrogenase